MSTERSADTKTLNRRVAFCVAVIFLVAALMLNVVKKVLLEETE